MRFRNRRADVLAVDIGNTFTRIAVFSGENVRGRRSFHTKGLTAQELVPAFAEMSSLSDSPDVWIASVSPGVNAIVDSAAGQAGLSRRFIKSGVDRIISHRLSTPGTTGVDRLLVAMAAGRRHFPGPKGGGGYVVVQCGSAATVDLVDANGVFRGGYIIPGPALWLSGLSGAAQLPDLSAELPSWEAVAAGDNTRDAILHGMAAALPAAVAAAAKTIRVNSEPAGGGGRVADGHPPFAITGGWGEAVAGILDAPCVYDRDLVLHGIRMFAES